MHIYGIYIASNAATLKLAVKEIQQQHWRLIYILVSLTTGITFMVKGVVLCIVNQINFDKKNFFLNWKKGNRT